MKATDSQNAVGLKFKIFVFIIIFLFNVSFNSLNRIIIRKFIESDFFF